MIRSSVGGINDDPWLANVKASGGAAPETMPAMIPEVNTAEGQCDLANARRLVAMFGEKIRYSHQWGRWLIWDGTRWQVDSDGAAERLAKSVADAIWSAAATFREANSLKWAMRSASSGGIRAMLSLAESEVPVSVDDLDQNGFLLNCPNGTVDLRTGAIREHRREDLITKLCPTIFNPDAASWVWDNFLEDVFAGAGDVIPFLQRYFGYCATGDVREQIIGVFHGGGSNGKSTLLEAVQSTLGADYSGSAPKDLLMCKKGDSHPTELADLFGMRLVIAQETDAVRTLAESLVKQLTGGDTVKARRMREDFWQFTPTHKIILCTNHKPRVKGTDHAIWRRLRLVPFNVRFDGDRKDKSMSQKLRDASEGILSWVVRGSVDWCSTGLREPETVMAATQSYRSDSDVVGRFIDDRCITFTGVKCKFSAFYEAFESWCDEAGEHAPGKRTVTDYLRDERGFSELRNNGLWFNGVGLKANGTTE